MSTNIASAVDLMSQWEERIAKAVEEEEADKEQTIAQCERLIAAGDATGFCGDLRRAIHGGGVSLEYIAAAAGIHVLALCDFLEGTAELTSGQVAAIVQRLGLQLVRPIPRDDSRSTRSPS